MSWWANIFSGSKKGHPERATQRRGVSRQQYRGSQSGDVGWEAGRNNNSMLSEWPVDSGTTPSAQLSFVLETIRTRARYAVQNDAIAASFLNKTVRAIVGDKGFMPVGIDPRHSAAIAAHSKRNFFCTDGRTSRSEFERLIIRHIVRDGEVLIARHFNYGGGDKSRFALSILDSGYLHTDLYNGDYEHNGNRVRHGIEVDKFGKTVAYHFRGRSSSNVSVWSYWTGDVIRVPAENILHLYTTDYADVNRGVSWLAPVLTTLEQLRRYRGHAMDAARLGAKMAITTETKSGDPIDGAAGYEVAEDAAEENPVASGRRPDPHFIRDFTGAQIISHDSEHPLKMNQASYPHQMYAAFHESMSKMIASGLDFPEAILTNNWDGINFSAGQLMLGDAEMKHRRLREWLKEYAEWWHTPWLTQATMRGAIHFPPSKVFSELEKIDWNGAVVPPADISKAAAANEKLINLGVKSRQQVCEELGLNWDEQKAKILAEREELGMPETSPAAKDEDDNEDDNGGGDDKKTPKQAAGGRKKAQTGDEKKS